MTLQYVPDTNEDSHLITEEFLHIQVQEWRRRAGKADGPKSSSVDRLEQLASRATLINRWHKWQRVIVRDYLGIRYQYVVSNGLAAYFYESFSQLFGLHPFHIYVLTECDFREGIKFVQGLEYTPPTFPIGGGGGGLPYGLQGHEDEIRDDFVGHYRVRFRHADGAPIGATIRQQLDTGETIYTTLTPFTGEADETPYVEASRCAIDAGITIKAVEQADDLDAQLLYIEHDIANLVVRLSGGGKTIDAKADQRTYVTRRDLAKTLTVSYYEEPEAE